MSRFFIDRPIFAWVVSIVILLLGLVSVSMLPIAQYPDITPPTVQVTCTYPGANSQVVADSVAAPIEQQVNGVERMLYMSSQCTNDGAYALTITFELGTDPNMAQVLVQNRVSLALPQLPTQVQVQGVSTKKKSPSILLAVNLISPNGEYDDLFLSNYATVYIKDELLRIPGVGDVNYMGQRDYSMRVWLDPDKMAARNLSTQDVVTAVQKQNVQVAAGQIGQQPVPAGQQFQFTMSTLGRLEDVRQFADIIVKTGQGNAEQGSESSQIVRLKDIARLQLGAQQYDQICRLDGTSSVGLAVFQLPGGNALETAELIKGKMEEIKKRFPSGIDYSIVYDTTPFIEQSVHEVFLSLRDAVLLVAIVVLLFLQDWKAMILPMIDVPVSLIGTFFIMNLMGFSLNNITLLAMVLAIGIVVDDAIVVLENIERQISLGLEPREATIKAMDEITGPIIAITLVLCSVFLPSVFIPGISGQFYKQFALVIASSMVISAINAMTLTPARAVTIFKGQGHGEHEREALPWWIFTLVFGFATMSWLPGLVPLNLGLPKSVSGIVTNILFFLPGAILGGLFGKAVIKTVNRVLAGFFKGFNRGFDWVANGYGWIVARMVRLSFIVLLIYGGLLVVTYLAMSRTPTGFIPTQDQGYLLINVQLPDSASVQRTSEVMRKVERILLGDDTGKLGGVTAVADGKKYEGIPGVAHAMTISGQSFLMNANGSNFGSCFAILDDFSRRKGHDTYDDVIAGKLRGLFASEIDDAVITVFRAPPIQGLGSAGGFKFQIEQRGFVDYPQLQKSVDDMIADGNKDPRLLGMFSLFRAETPQYFIDIDRTKAESLGVDMNAVFNTLQVYMGGQFVNLFNRFGRTWQVNLMAEERFRTQPEYLAQLKVPNKLGEMVPLGTLVQVKEVGGPVMTTRYNMYTTASISGNPAPGASTGQAIAAITELADRYNLDFEWTEITFMQIQAGSSGMSVFFLGTLLVFLVLAAKYESWSLPLSVILVVPLCLLAAIVGVIIAKLDINIFVQVGFLVLVGLAAKNAILIVEFAKALEDEGKERFEATVESARLRLRPIVMTSFAFIFGVVPLVLGHGAGAEMRFALGVAVFAGMIGVTVFGIFLTPVFYYVIRNFAAPVTGKAAVKTAPPAASGH